MVTNDVHAVTGTERVRPEKALVAGPVRTIPSECPGLSCVHIDVEWPDSPVLRGQVVAAVVTELQHVVASERRLNPLPIVAHRGRHRWVQAFEPVAGAGEAGDARLRDGGVYVVTGGLGGVGLALAGALAEEAHARLVLVGRTVFPAREAWDEIVSSGQEAALAARIEVVRALEAAGAEVLIVAADVASEEDVARVVTQTRARFGDIHGVVHAAGVGGEGIITLKSRADAERVLRPKVAGTRQLMRALEGEPLDFVVLCSSLTSVLGGVGQADYGAANAFLDSYAQACWCAGDSRVVSINWDTWRDVGMAVGGAVPAPFADRKAQAIESGITVAEGREVLLRALGLRLPQVAVCTKDLGLFIEALDRRSGRRRTVRFARACRYPPCASLADDALRGAQSRARAHCLRGIRTGSGRVVDRCARQLLRARRAFAACGGRDVTAQSPVRHERAGGGVVRRIDAGAVARRFVPAPRGSADAWCGGRRASQGPWSTARRCVEAPRLTNGEETEA